MSISFEFNQQLMPQNVVDIEELGSFALEATNDEGYCWYLVVKTSLGNTTIAECGPVIPDIVLLPDGYKTELTKTQYKEDKLIKKINFWLNDKSKKITSARVVQEGVALGQFRDIAYYIQNVNEELY